MFRNAAKFAVYNEIIMNPNNHQVPNAIQADRLFIAPPSPLHTNIKTKSNIFYNIWEILFLPYDDNKIRQFGVQLLTKTFRTVIDTEAAINYVAI